MRQNEIPEWNLKDLYKSIDDPKIKKDKKEIESKIKKLKSNFKKNSLTSSLELYEEISHSLSVLNNYAYLNHSTDTKDEKVSKFYQSTNEYINDIESKLLWFKVYLTKSNDKSEKFNYFLKTTRSLKPYTLDEDKEVLLTKKRQTGAESFIRFYDQIDSNKDFDGKTYSELSTTFASDPNRNKRKEAGQIIQKNLKDNSLLYKFILNTLLLDKKVDDEIRGFKYPQESTFLDYDIMPKVVETMSAVIIKNYKISEKYYLAKSKLLNMKLFEWDRYSDIYPNTKSSVSWEDSKKIVLNSFSNFSEKFAVEAEKFFDNNWIDAKLKIGKSSGAYCSYVSNSVHPYVFMNFAGEQRDVETLAHELGHGLHCIFAKNNNYLDFMPSTATAEIASTFAELLVFEDLYKKAKTKKEKINLLGGKLQGAFATIFRQNAFYLFESELHKLRREKGELSLDEICNLYQKHLQPMFGKGLTLSDDHKYMWMVISHFYHYNFYVFTYSFGELLATSLYAIYKREGQKFVDKYILGLSLGGSKSPAEITKVMGVDITKEDFWQSGLDLINEQVKEFEKLVI
ncbi:MAG: M3 family oligoendopeptidase [Microgenomates group bacterium]